MMNKIKTLRNKYVEEEENVKMFWICDMIAHIPTVLALAICILMVIIAII